MEKAELLRHSLELKHTVILEEYKLSLAFIFSLVGGISIASYYSLPNWYFFFASSCFVGYATWRKFSAPKRSELHANRVMHQADSRAAIVGFAALQL